MKTLLARGLFVATLGAALATAGGCSSGDDDSGAQAGTGSGGTGSSGTGGGPLAGTVPSCGFCAKSADCMSGFCNGLNAERGVCTEAGDLSCSVSSTAMYRGLSGKEQSLATAVPQAGEPGTATTYDADDPNIQYFGRVDRDTDPKAPRFSAPAVTVRARFSGTSAAVLLADQFRYGRRNYFDAIIDEGKVDDSGASLAISVKILPEKGVTRYDVMAGLPAGDHSITLVKRTESSIGYTDFLGFEFDGTILDMPAVPRHKLQIIGDSINCGVGDDLPKHTGTTDIEGTFCKEDTWGVPYHDAFLAFGVDTARHFGAEYQVAAVSGIGLIRDYSSKSADDTRPLPEVYDSLFLEDKASPAWDPKAFVPDAVLIALGTNDFSPGDNPTSSPRERMTVDAFVAAYVDFLDKLMGSDYYPDAQFFVLGSPMLGDGYPDATYTYRTDLETAIAEVEAHYAATSANVHAVKLQKTFGKGCGTHPAASEHETVAVSDLEPAVAAVMGW